jgi:hypothetical protein
MFTVPAGVGKNISLRLTVGARTSNLVSFAYDPPYVASISPDEPNGEGDTIK